MMLLLPLAAAPAYSADLDKINVLADPALSVALSVLARQFAAQHGIGVTTAYGPAKQHHEAIQQGLEADVFITANSVFLDALLRQGLLDVYSRTAIAKDRLSFVGHRDDGLQLVLVPKLPIATILARLSPDYSFAIGDPDYEFSGHFALRALRNFEMDAELEPHTLFIRNSMDFHRSINQPHHYAVMYRSEAMRNPKLRIIATFNEVAHDGIFFYAMAVAGENMDAARRFIAYLTSEAAQDVFASLGFESLTTYTDESGHLARGSAVSGSGEQPL
jgi:molybdate transport system substrate-binding protein